MPLVLRAAYLNPERTHLINRAIDSCISMDYDRATSIIDSLIIREPERPEAWFFRAAISSIRMTDEESFRLEDYFYANLDSARSRLRTLSQAKVQTTADLEFMDCSIDSYLAYHYSRKHLWFKAARHGFRAIDKLEELLLQYPDFEDLRLGLGNYAYWKSVKMKQLSWLPFIKDERQRGIQMVERARHRGAYNSWVAASNLCWMYLEEKMAPQAEAVCREGLQHYPDSRLFLFPLGDALIQQHRFEESLAVYNRIIGQLADNPANNGVNAVICREKICRILLAVGHGESATAMAKEALDIPVSKALTFRLKDQRKRLKAVVGGQNPWQH